MRAAWFFVGTVLLGGPAFGLPMRYQAVPL